VKPLTRRACRAAILATAKVSLILLASPVDARDYRIVSAGEEKILRLSGLGQVVEIDASGAGGNPQMVEPQVILQASRAVDVPGIAASCGASSWRLSGVGRHYVLQFSDSASALAAAELLQGLGHEASPRIKRQQRSRFTPGDRLFRDQWHLLNTGQRGSTKGIDLNVSPVWTDRRGNGISVGVVDDGLQLNHPDLTANAFPLSSGIHRDFIGYDVDPSPSRLDVHGTCVAGVLAAASNLIGGLGVAPEAKLAGLRLTSAATDGPTEAAAFAWKNEVLSVYNNSWGPADDGGTVSRPEAVARDAIVAASIFGRGGRGNIFVWAGGNGRTEADDANYDGYANMPETIAVGAVSDRGLQTSESERGANIVVVAPSSSSRRQGIVCTDLTARRGYNSSGLNDGTVVPSTNYPDLDYTNDFGMTSGAAPQVSGVVALMLQANPRLGWRDVQEILISTARRVSFADKDWRKNSAGISFNHKFGAGLVDAYAAVQKAVSWQNLPAATSVSLAKKGLNLPIPEAATSGTVVEFELSDTTKYAPLRIEHALFTVSLKHAYRGDLRFVLTSPSGMTSVVESRPNDSGRSLSNWAFMSVRHWGENSTGKWKLAVLDTFKGDVGTLTSATLTLRGTRLSAAMTTH
jgi:subtilisin-like proprotein convertase family protein